MMHYGIYRGDKFLFVGTLKECAKFLNVQENTVRFYSYPSNLKRYKENHMIAVKFKYNEKEDKVVFNG